MVADGVGGWEQIGYDSGIYSKKLVQMVEKYFDAGYSGGETLHNVLMQGSKADREIGSSTLVVAAFDQNDPNTLRTTNYGDSGYMIIRASKDKPRTLERLFTSEHQ
mmetsp:Transcript_13395/g.22812  ORF Transcript_13395/g.22812 Transcript_13395/m.22812 type:complete len:106 (-) Transcript_13395:3-320(-)